MKSLPFGLQSSLTKLLNLFFSCLILYGAPQVPSKKQHLSSMFMWTLLLFGIASRVHIGSGLDSYQAYLPGLVLWAGKKWHNDLQRVLRSKLLCAVDELFVYRYCVLLLLAQQGNHVGVQRIKGKLLLLALFTLSYSRVERKLAILWCAGTVLALGAQKEK